MSGLDLWLGNILISEGLLSVPMYRQSQDKHDTPEKLDNCTNLDSIRLIIVG